MHGGLACLLFHHPQRQAHIKLPRRESVILSGSQCLTPIMKIISANLNGIRSASRTGFFPSMTAQNADFVCAQELKAQEADMTTDLLTPEGYLGYLHDAQKKGYSGAGVYCRRKPEHVQSGFNAP